MLSALVTIALTAVRFKLLALGKKTKQKTKQKKHQISPFICYSKVLKQIHTPCEVTGVGVARYKPVCFKKPSALFHYDSTGAVRPYPPTHRHTNKRLPPK